MIDLSHSPVAFVTGVISGFMVSIPVGPINVAIINEGARRGFKWAALIGLGSVVMETIYCAFAFAGFSAFFDTPMIKAAMELVSFIFMLYLGFKYLLAKSVPEHVASVDRIEQRLHPHSAFMIGFVRVLGNPSVLLLWMTLVATFLAHNWVDRTLDDKAACVLGVAAGAATWFFALSYAVAWGGRRWSPKALLYMERVSGAFLLIAALWMGGSIVKHLHKREIHINMPLHLNGKKILTNSVPPGPPGPPVP